MNDNQGDRIRWRLIAWAVLAWALTAAGLASAPVGDWSDDLDVAVGEAMAEYGIPGVSLAVIDRYDVVYAQAYGEAEPGRPVTTDTLFQAASLTKPVAAVIAAAAGEAGILDLDADIDDSLDRWRMPPYQYDETITLRMLLAHRAGINVRGFPGYRLDETIPETARIPWGVRDKNEPLRVVSEPGADRAYSGGGFVIAHIAMEDASDLTFEELAVQYVFEPLALDLSTMELLDASARARVAVGHRSDGSQVAGGGWHLYPEGAAGSMWTTAEEYAEIVADVMRSAEVDGGVVLGQATARSLLDPDFAVGFGISREEGGIAIGHDGHNEGYRSAFRALPHLGQGIVVLTNSDDGHLLATDLIDFAADRFAWPWTAWSTPLWAVLLGLIAFVAVTAILWRRRRSRAAERDEPNQIAVLSTRY